MQLEQVVMQWNTILFQLFYGWTVYLFTDQSVYFTVEFPNEASQFQCKFWEKRDITVQPVITYIYLCVRWYAALLSYFFKPSNWNVRQAWENLYTIGILSYTDCWCLLPFSSNTVYPATVHVKCVCYGYRIKRECNISFSILRQWGTQQKILLLITLS